MDWKQLTFMVFGWSPLSLVPTGHTYGQLDLHAPVGNTIVAIQRICELLLFKLLGL